MAERRRVVFHQWAQARVASSTPYHRPACSVRSPHELLDDFEVVCGVPAQVLVIDARPAPRGGLDAHEGSTRGEGASVEDVRVRGACLRTDVGEIPLHRTAACGLEVNEARLTSDGEHVEIVR